MRWKKTAARRQNSASRCMSQEKEYYGQDRDVENAATFTGDETREEQFDKYAVGNNGNMDVDLPGTTLRDKYYKSMTSSTDSCPWDVDSLSEGSSYATPVPILVVEKTYRVPRRKGDDNGSTTTPNNEPRKVERKKGIQNAFSGLMGKLNPSSSKNMEFTDTDFQETDSPLGATECSVPGNSSDEEVDYNDSSSSSSSSSSSEEEEESSSSSSSSSEEGHVIYSPVQSYSAAPDANCSPKGETSQVNIVDVAYSRESDDITRKSGTSMDTDLAFAEGDESRGLTDMENNNVEVEPASQTSFERTMNIIAFPERHFNCSPLTNTPQKLTKKVNCSAPDHSTFEKTVDVVAYPERHGYTKFANVVDAVAFPERHINCSPAKGTFHEAVDVVAYPERHGYTKFAKAVDAVAFPERHINCSPVTDNCTAPDYSVDKAVDVVAYPERHGFSKFSKAMDEIAFPERHMSCASTSNSGKDKNWEEDYMASIDGVISPRGCDNIEGCTVPDDGKVSNQETYGYRADLLDYLCGSFEKLAYGRDTKKETRDDTNATMNPASTKLARKNTICPDLARTGGDKSQHPKDSESNNVEATPADQISFEKVMNIIAFPERHVNCSPLSNIKGSSCGGLACAEAIPERGRTDLDDVEVPNLPRNQSLVSDGESSACSKSEASIPTMPRRQSKIGKLFGNRSIASDSSSTKKSKENSFKM